MKSFGKPAADERYYIHLISPQTKASLLLTLIRCKKKKKRLKIDAHVLDAILLSEDPRI